MFQLGKAARSEPERRESTDSARRGGQRAVEHCRAVGRRREYRSVNAAPFNQRLIALGVSNFAVFSQMRTAAFVGNCGN